MSKEYLVTWGIDVDAENPIQAAEQALEIQRDTKSLATVFEITGGERAYRVDLGQNTQVEIQPEGSATEQVLRKLINTVNATGGVTKYTETWNGGPAGDPEWLDLGEVYRDACRILGVPPLETDGGAS